MSTKVLVLGANFGGMTAALSVKSELGADVDVMVVAPSAHFLFTPSLVWLPFGRRHRDDITFRVEPTFDAHGVEFVQAEAAAVDPVAHRVTLGSGDMTDYDYLVVATGFRSHADAVPGLTDNASTITGLAEAERSAAAWRRFLHDPGDVVVAASQGSGCLGVAHEFLLTTAYHLEKAGLHREVRLTYVTPEPFLGHRGTAIPYDAHQLDVLVHKARIEVRSSTSIDHVDRGELVLADGEAIPFSFAMVVPPFVGQEFLRDADWLGGDGGFVRVRDTCQSETYDDVYAVGVAAAVDAPWHIPTPGGVPRTGFPTEVMARTAARNISSQVRGEQPTASVPFDELASTCGLRGGLTGAATVTDAPPIPRRRGELVPGPQAYLRKIRYEKYFLWKMRHGHIHLQ